MINYKQAGQRIRKQRKLLGITQEILAERINITPSFYSQIESGTRKAGIKTFVSISQELSISLDYILGNKVNDLSEKNFDDTEQQIFYRIRGFSSKQKKFVLDVIMLLEKFIDT